MIECSNIVAATCTISDIILGGQKKFDRLRRGNEYQFRCHSQKQSRIINHPLSRFLNREVKDSRILTGDVTDVCET